jgi:hypothetical protein
MSGDTTPQTQTQSQFSSSSPWAAQIPYLMQGFNAAGGLLNTPQYMPAALNNVWSFANSPTATPNVNAASNQLQQTLNGNYLTGGAGFNSAFDAAKRQILPQVDSQFASAGRTGSGLAQTAETQALGDSFSGLYNQERNRQMSAAGMAPNLDEMPFQMQQQKMQDMLTAGGAGQDAIMNFMRTIGGNYGGTTSGNSSGTMTPAQYNNPLEEGLGIGGLLSSMLGNPFAGFGFGTGGSYV